MRVQLAKSMLARRGRNLAERHARLSRKPVFPLNAFQEANPNRQTPVNTFRGLVIPQRPRPPSPEECCMARCEVCVHDLYIVSLQQYHRDIAQIRAALDNMQVDQRDWPFEVRSEGMQTDEKMKQEEQDAAALAERAFQAMERSNKEPRTKPQDTALEVFKLVLWALRGCPG